MPLNAGDRAEVLVEKPAAGGAMLARVDGQIVFVTGGIPGERVRVSVDRVAKSVAHAHVVDVLAPSPDRRDPPGDPLCGGCLYAHVDYRRQLTLKSEVIADAFARIGKLALPAPVAVAGSRADGYRMRARLHVRGGRLGFFREATHEVCDPRQTGQLLPASCDALDRLMASARSAGAAGALRELELSENVPGSERVAHLETAQAIERPLLDAMFDAGGFSPGPFVNDIVVVDGRPLSFRRHVLAFFQGNRYLLGDLVAHVAGQVPAGARLVDLYAGAGLFAVAAAVLRGATVVAVEGDRYAADDLRANALAAGGAIDTRRSSVEAYVHEIGGVDAVVVDPPRTGMTPEALGGVLRAGPSTLIYVSCDVATLARDARIVAARGYAIAAVQAFDLFPNTPHVETVVVFER